MLFRFRILCRVAAEAAMILTMVAGQAAASEVLSLGRSGTLACGGNYSFSQSSVWVLRNYNVSEDIAIQRLRFIDASGTVIFDSGMGGLPPSSNGLLGPGDNTLGPNQSTAYLSDALLDQGVLPADMLRPIQVMIDWSADARVARPTGAVVRVSYKVDVIFDPDTGNTIQVRGREIGRHRAGCNVIRVR